MSDSTITPKRILFVMSDTGGGHRAAAEAIRDALIERHGADNIAATLVDGYRVMPFPMNKMPEFYPIIVNRSKRAWKLLYGSADSVPRSRRAGRLLYRYSRRALRRMVRDHHADVIVIVHSVLTRPTVTAYHSYRQRPPIVTVVTDLVSTPMLWYDSRVERCLVPTQTALERGIEAGMSPDQLRVTGLPVHPAFNRALTDRASARAELGWDAELPAILMVSGSEGVGPMYETARAIDAQNLSCQIAVVAGKNKALKARLESATWNQPTHVYPYVTNMPTLMAAADALVTKAGPATICEACIAGLPLILSDAIPGQEDGNIDFVVDGAVGVFAPQPEQVAKTVAAWLANDGAELRQRAANAEKLARPDAVWAIADEVWQYAGQPRVVTRR